MSSVASFWLYKIKLGNEHKGFNQFFPRDKYCHILLVFLYLYFGRHHSYSFRVLYLTKLGHLSSCCILTKNIWATVWKSFIINRLFLQGLIKVYITKHNCIHSKELMGMHLYRYVIFEWVSFYKFVLTYFSWEMSLLQYLLWMYLWYQSSTFEKIFLKSIS